MAEKIAILNFKGGVGRTTTAVNLSCSLAHAGKKVLAVDLCQQGNLGAGLGVETNGENTMYEVFEGELAAKDAIIETQCVGVDAMVSNINITAIEAELDKAGNNVDLLRDKLAELDPEYDYIIMDCPSHLGPLSVNALVAANSVIVPVQCEFYALTGLVQTKNTIKLVEDRLIDNPLTWRILFTMHNANRRLSSEVIEDVKSEKKLEIFKTVIPCDAKLAEAPSFGQPILLYSRNSPGAKAYLQLANEVMDWR